MQKVKAKKINARDCKLIGADLRDADLRESDFQRAKIDKASFLNAKVEGICCNQKINTLPVSVNENSLTLLVLDCAEKTIKKMKQAYVIAR